MVIRLLRVCVAVSASALAIGLIWALAHGSTSLPNAPEIMMIRAGLGLLVAIPILNLFGVLAGAVKGRDWTTVVAIVVVLVVMAFNVVWITALRSK